MSNSTAIQIGGIYKTEWDHRPFRLIGFDDYEVFYDCMWTDGQWTFSGNFKKKCYFYRTSLKTFKNNLLELDFLALSEAEIKFFRTDLPMRLGRTELYNWNDFKADNYHDFKKQFHAQSNNFIAEEILLTDRIILIPYGIKKGFLKATVSYAANNSFFELAELIWKAKQLQEAANHSKSEGIGIYRLGTEKGIPSFYIGEFYDLAGILKPGI